MKTANNSSIQRGGVELQDAILENITNPAQLEKLYRKYRSGFIQSFNRVYPQIKDDLTAQIWNQRLNQQDEFSYYKKEDVRFIFVATLISGMIAHLPKLTGVDTDLFLQKNIGFIVFPMLVVFFAIKQKLTFSQLIIPLVSILMSAFYINLLPSRGTSDSVLLASFHLPVFLWSMLGYTYVGGSLKETSTKIDYLRFNANCIVMMAIIVLSGIVFTAITMGLFGIIGMDIEQFYTENILTWGLPAVPIVSTFLVYTNPQLVNKISPTIARIFTPVVFAMLLIFLGAMLYTGKNLYYDRDALIVFNALLVGVMAIVLFSATAGTNLQIQKLSCFILLGLSILTLVLNGLALSAIVFRLTEFGLTPNRVAVLGANVLIFSHLVLVSNQLFLFLRGKATISTVEQIIALFLPVYGVWTAFVTFVLPLLFEFK